MGAVTSYFLRLEPEEEDPNKYIVHDLNYWPGKATPPNKWHTLLPSMQAMPKKQQHKNKSLYHFNNNTRKYTNGDNLCDKKAQQKTRSGDFETETVVVNKQINETYQCKSLSVEDSVNLTRNIVKDLHVCDQERLLSQPKIKLISPAISNNGNIHDIDSEKAVSSLPSNKSVLNKNGFRNENKQSDIKNLDIHPEHSRSNIHGEDSRTITESDLPKLQFQIHPHKSALKSDDVKLTIEQESCKIDNYELKLETESPFNKTCEGDVLKDMNSNVNMKDVKPENRWLHASYPFDNLALSGGGMKAYSYIGVVKALEDAGVMSQIKRFSGTSSGAMCAATLALGYSAQEICKCFYVDLSEVLEDQRCASILCVPKLYTRYGIHPAKRLFYWNSLVIGAKTGGNVDITFKEHYEQFGKELCIVVCNITRMATEYCHYTTTPDLPIRDAVRMSMAVPVVYEPAKMEVNGQVNYYIDGGVVDHFPIHCYDGPTVGANLNGEINPKTIGFYVLSEKDTEHVLWRNSFGKEIPNKPTYMPDTKLARGQLQDEIKRRKKSQKNFDEKTFMRQLEKFSRMSMETLGMKHYETHNKTQVDTSNILAYLLTNLELMINTQIVSKMKPQDESRTIPINVGYMETHAYDLEPGDREFMIKQGYASTKNFLQQYEAKHRTSCN